jgi:gliding motility-associated-like protein
MNSNRLRGNVMRYCCTLLMAMGAVTGYTQLCPPNLDFEKGDFSNWQCRTGTVAAVGGTNVITWTGTFETTGRHTIIPAASSGMDPFGNFPESCPNGSGYSIRLGNNASGNQAEGISYTYTIPAATTSFSIIYYYAIVIQDPNHLVYEQPRFQAKVIDMSDNSEINCVSFDFTASASLPGFSVSTINPQVIYKDWTPITLDLSSYAGKTIRLDFTTSDCTRGGHFGYAYIDVNAACNGAIIGSTVCAGEDFANLQAPFGFQEYKWFSDNSFTTELSTSQSLLITPAPSVGSTYPVIVTPYNGFGCVDTLYATITTAPKPISDAGIDNIICRGQGQQIGTAANPIYSYSWMPVNLLNNPALSNPTATAPGLTPVEFIVKTTDLLTGCFSYDTTILTPVPVDTSLKVTGQMLYCIGEPLNTTLTASSGGGIQWYQDNNPIPGAVNTTFQPTIAGFYWAQVTQGGCTDSTRKEQFIISQKPVPDFTIVKDTQCVNTSLNFTNLSTIAPTEPLMSWWKFGDNDFSSNPDPSKTFTSPGVYTTELVVSTINGCKDSTRKQITIMPNGIPDFNWDSICVNRPTQFLNLSNENGSVKVDYYWDFGNSLTSDIKIPPTISYDVDGLYDVTLRLTTLGCEAVPQSITKKIQANYVEPGIRYKSKTVAEGYTEWMTIRDTVGNNYVWQPELQLNNYSTPRALFMGVDDVEYTITITNDHTCVTVDTLQVYVLKKPGVYLPTAFTPNGDGLNDVVRPFLVRMKSLKRFSIFNRGGNLVFSTTRDGEGWDGTFKGQRLDSGVFVWMIEYITTDNKPAMAKGTITLVR